MTQQQKDSHPLLHVRSVAGCIHHGWALLADHMWDFVRGGAPILILAILAGIAAGLLLPWYDTTAVNTLLLTTDGVISLLWIIQIAGLVLKYHRLSYIPSLRPLYKSKRHDNRATAFAFWQKDWQEAARGVLRLFGLMVQTVRRWGHLIGILIVGGLVSICFTMVASLPYLVLYFTHFAGQLAVILGDAVQLPSLMPLLATLAGIIASVASFLFSLFLLLPLAYFGGSLTKEKRDKEQARKMEQAVHD